VFVASIAVGAYAEVQNVKVSGDLLMRAISRDNFTLSKDVKYHVSGLTTTSRIRVDADLTDNVATTVRLLNERSWGLENNGANGGNNDVSIDLAYVTLKEFLYSPLTLTIGRQEMKFGNGLVIGDPDTLLFADEVTIPWDLSSRKSFDAIRATLNYDPLVVDLVYAKISENDAAWWQQAGLEEKNDINLYGVNALYNLGMNNATAEVYWFSRVNDNEALLAGAEPMLKKDVCNTTGLLVQGEIVPKMLKASVEYARQFGTANTYLQNVIGTTAKRSAWATQVMLTLLYQDQPAAGLGYSYLSGNKKDFGPLVGAPTRDKMTGWDPMFQSQICNNVVNAILPTSNCQSIHAWAGMKPREDITVSAVYGFYRLVKETQDVLNGAGAPLDARLLGNVPYGPNTLGGLGFYNMTDKKNLGNAIDLTAIYDYTEDVQFGLTFGYMWLGNAFSKSTNAVACPPNVQNPRQLIGSMKVTF